VVALAGKKANPIAAASDIAVRSNITGLLSKNALEDGIFRLSLSETQSCWQLMSNRAMLLPYARGL
jgi:hypothetical protein